MFSAVYDALSAHRREVPAYFRLRIALAGLLAGIVRCIRYIFHTDDVDDSRDTAVMF